LPQGRSVDGGEFHEADAESVDDIEALGSFGNFGFAIVERGGSCSDTSIDCNGASEANLLVARRM
jgi:hypothetical protein